MSPGEMVLACTATAAGLGLTATYALDCWHKRSTRRRFQQTAKAAARTPRTEADVQADLAKYRARLERLQFDAEFTQIIADEYPTIPHQRQPRKDQP